jgi:hypothetical protein
VRVPDCFQTLGIGPVTDRKTIRQAYAARLKAMDIEADPDDYARLRDARDAALRYVEGASFADADMLHSLDELPVEMQPEAAPTLAADSDTDSAAHLPDDGDTMAAGEVEALREELARDTNLIAGILETAHQEERWLREDEHQEIARTWDHFVANPLLEHVGLLAQGSDIFAEILAYNLPQSDLLIEPAALFFGWTTADELAANPALASVLDRRRDLGFARELDQPSHPLHRAWKELRKPANDRSSRGWLVSTAKVQELLTLVRTRHPTLEYSMDSWRVGLWERKGAGSRRTIFFAVWFVLVIAHLGLRYLQTDPAPTAGASELVSTAQPLRSSEEEWRTLASDLGLEEDPAGVRNRNPALYAWFERDWDNAAAQGRTLDNYRAGIRNSVYQMAHAQWPNAPISLLRKRAELDRATFTRLASTPDLCAEFVDGKMEAAGSEYSHAFERLTVKLIDKADPAAPLPEAGGTFNYTIPGEVIELAAKRARLEPKAFLAALDAKGATKTGCAARASLSDAMLAAPSKISAKVLRDRYGG